MLRPFPLRDGSGEQKLFLVFDLKMVNFDVFWRDKLKSFSLSKSSKSTYGIRPFSLRFFSSVPILDSWGRGYCPQCPPGYAYDELLDIVIELLKGCYSLQCFDTVDWVTAVPSGLLKILLQPFFWESGLTVSNSSEVGWLLVRQKRKVVIQCCSNFFVIIRHR